MPLNEIIIDLSSINSRDFFGSQNEHIQLIKARFPQLKIVARGHNIKAYGEEDQLASFESKIKELILHFTNFGKIEPQAIEQLLDGGTEESNFHATPSETLLHGVNGKIIKARTINQQKLVESIQKNDMVFAIGPAGTGKTYTGVAMAVKALKEKAVRRIILTRPAVEAGENLGFLPGDLKEKLDPYMQPLYDALRDMVPAEKLEKFLNDGTIQIAPMAFMRGRTLDNAFVILDEAQNTTHAQMKMFLTRMGRNAKFMITGDPGQIDLPRRVISGLKEALLVLKNVKGIGMVYLDDRDVIRHRLVKAVIEAYKDIEHQNQF